MWLANLEFVWQEDSQEGLRATDLTLELLVRTKALLGDGKYWCAEALATSAGGKQCDPFSSRARRFSLLGAAVRARWDLREIIAESEVNPAHVHQVMKAIAGVATDDRGDGSGSSFACAILDGMIEAVQSYREQQVSEMRVGRAA